MASPSTRVPNAGEVGKIAFLDQSRSFRLRRLTAKTCVHPPQWSASTDGALAEEAQWLKEGRGLRSTANYTPLRSMTSLPFLSFRYIYTVPRRIGRTRQGLNCTVYVRNHAMRRPTLGQCSRIRILRFFQVSNKRVVYVF